MTKTQQLLLLIVGSLVIGTGCSLLLPSPYSLIVALLLGGAWGHYRAVQDRKSSGQ